ncbi:FtsX-like permease family protein [Rhodocytophaga rosea]|uniref:FtsX-like permease family protein n=1 Tax=Rhodocytophaga rosea TaxID=2704465 RepID=A0A6C0GSK2_9BACT|nr:ABC transporter permease [Rhodocytophaga rosea]QHT70440.1 FtsX-like permease family protein [Rhodocytophaga rosea]
MLKNYITVAIRNLLKYKVYSFINIFGLAVGIACCLFIFLFIQNELNYDKFHADGKRIYRLIRSSDENGERKGTPATSGPYAPSLQTDFPSDIEETMRVDPDGGGVLITIDNQSFMEKQCMFVDSNFFQFFSFPLEIGDPKTVLNAPNSMVLSRAAAKKYFGNANPIGKVLTMDGEDQFKVTGIMGPLPGNSHFAPDMLVPISLFKNQEWFNEWWNNSMSTYVRLSPKVTEKQFEAKLPAFMDKYMGEEFKKFGMKVALTLQPLESIYFDNETQYDHASHGDKKVVYIFTAIALFILMIACINFMNLSTARSMGRAKEVGLRKVMGAYKSHLVSQFLSESIVLSFISLILALGFVWLLKPAFDTFLEKELTIPYGTFFIILILLGISVLVGLLAGSYPAFFLSSFQPIKVLKGRFKANPQSAWLRKGLVVVQFSISIILIIGTFIITSQMEFTQQKKLGYDKEHVVLVRITNSDIRTNKDRFKTILEGESDILSISAMSGEPGGFHDRFIVDIPGKTEEKWQFRTVFTDFDYAKTLGMKIVAGRDFSRDFGTDTTQAAIINETAVKKLGWTNEEALGKDITITLRESGPRKIVGIVQDFHISSLKDKIDPMVIAVAKDNRVLALKIKSGNPQQTLQKIEKAWLTVAPQYPFEYTFLDQVYDNLYKSEQKQMAVFTVFAFIAICIACLGLFGLAAFTAEQRTKEISVRKVLGADVSSIVLLLSKDFVKLVVIALVIASPVAWYAMNKWLEDFEYSIGIKPDTFIIAGICAITIALVTVSYHAIKTAYTNPVKTLRNE